jgi:hypothetical protein
MRFENGRGMPLTIALAAVIGVSQGWVGTTRADGYRLHCTIPKTVAAVDFSTGQQMMAPPIPYGHYAKGGLLDCAGCRMHGLLGCHGCGHGLGSGGGHGLFGHGGHGGHGSACVGPGCDDGHGWGHHGAGRYAPIDSGVAGCGGGMRCGHGFGKHHGAPVVATGPLATTQAPLVVQPSGQTPCGDPGCRIGGKHHHGKGLHSRLCGLCGGRGCGGCGGHGWLGGCGDPGCNQCGGGHGCKFCGGKGCLHCLSGLHGRLAGLLHHAKVDYFVGAGGPVPITPGYVPYVVTTRSPREFFAFPPMNPFDP